MACQRCGECCGRVAFNLADAGGRSHDKDWLRLHGIIVTDTMAMVPLKCQWYVESGGVGFCRDYENRPAICRKWSCPKAGN